MKGLELLTTIVLATMPAPKVAVPMQNPVIEETVQASSIDTAFYQALDDSLRSRGVVTQVNPGYQVNFVGASGTYTFQGLIVMQHENPEFSLRAPIAKLAPRLSDEEYQQELANKQKLGAPLNSDQALLFLYRGEGAVTSGLVDAFLHYLRTDEVPTERTSFGAIKAIY